MSSRPGRRIVSTAVVAVALAGALTSGGGTAMAGSLAQVENLIGEGANATWASADEVGSSDTLAAGSVAVLSPMDAGSVALGSVCAAVMNALIGEKFCLARPWHGPGRG